MQSEQGLKTELADLSSIASSSPSDIVASPHFILYMMIDNTPERKIHDPDSPVKMMEQEENFDPETVLASAIKEVVWVTFYIPIENVKGLEKIVSNQAPLLAATMEKEVAALSKMTNLRKNLNDYINGPCRDMHLYFVNGVTNVVVKN